MKNTYETLYNFYNDKVVLNGDKISELIDKKNKNIERLQDGIKKYNDDNKKNYKMIDNITQGSVAMCTTIDPEYDDFDIDVGIVFNKDSLSDSTDEVKNLIIDFLEPYNYLFKENPKKKKNCIRINYQDNYHVDLAIYRKNGSCYEHCGETWTDRNPRSINKWFKQENDKYNNSLRIITRYLKYFAKSRKEWDMCGGLIITILVSEQLEKADLNKKIDEILIDVINGIIGRLEFDTNINNPTNGKNIIVDEKSRNKVIQFKEKLRMFAESINEAYALNEYEAKNKSWNSFFNTDYFTVCSSRNTVLENNEMFIDNFYEMNNNYSINFEIKCQRYISNNPENYQRSTHINCSNGIPFSLINTKSSFAAWLDNQNIRNQLKFDIKICLIKNGYPPQYSPEVFSQVMEQTENFEKYNS